MSTMKMDSFCNKFQANIFNKSKCQNCFKSRELHLRTNEDLNQAKPIYGGWLCLAPEGTDFGNLAQRSRKWQRRFFILYEHGSLHFALDESPNTLPQGTVNMNLCTDVLDAETRTGQRNALCIVTPDQEFYIRGENKDIINGWSEQLVVYPLANKQNRKKTKSKEKPPVAKQVPENDKPSGVKYGISSDSAQMNSSQEKDKCPRLESDSARDQLASLPSSGSSSLGKDSPPLPSPGSLAGASHSQQDSEASANNHTDSQMVTSPQSVPASPVCVSNPGARSEERRREEPFPVKSEVWRSQAGVHVADPVNSSSSSRQTRAGLQLHPTQRPKGPDMSHTPHSPEGRAQSPDPRSSESVMTPDLLNFKKGWLMILEEQNQWKKNWFVLSTHKLRYYRDSVAEEASELVGEIDLTTCHQVTEQQVQRNYGFQIHTQTQVHTFAAMTAGIRRNWIQALAKNVRPSSAPDVTNPSDDLCPFGSSVGALPEPDLTRDSFSPGVSAKMRHAAKSRSSRQRREGGHGKPCGGAALRLTRRSLPKGDDDEPTAEMWSVERRRRRREERRKRYESVMGTVLELGCQEDEVQVGMGTGASYAHQSSHEQQQQRAWGIEECWQRVEKTGIREERRVPLYPDTQAKDVSELDRMLHNYKRRVEELSAQLAGSSGHREEQSLDQQINSTWDLQLENSDVQEHQETPVKMDSSPYRSHLSSLTHKYKETKELLRLEEVRRQQMQEQLSFGPSTVDQSSLSLCDALMDNGQGSITSETGCPELLEHLSLTSFEELRSSSAAQVRQCPSQSEADNQVNSDVEKKLMQEVADLSHRNEALNQRNQEMVHQLTEADREIERLRAELDERQDGRPQVSALEELTSGRLECLENELREKCLELQEVQAQLDVQSEKLRDALSQLQLREATLEGLGFQACTPKDHQTHTALQEALEDRMEDQLDYTELHAREAQGQKPSTPVMSCCQRGEVIQSQVELDVQRTQNSETESEEQTSDGRSPEEVGVQQLMDEIQMRSKELGSLLKGMGEADLPTLVSSASEMQDFDTNQRITDRLRQEEEIWATLMNFLKASPPLLCAEANVSHGLTAEAARARLMEIKLYLSTHKHFSSSPINSAIVSNAPDASRAQKSDGSVLPESSVSGAETAELTAELPEQQAERILSLYKHICSDSLWRELRASVNLKASLLKCIASSLDSSVNTELRCTVQNLCSLWHRPADLELINIQAISSELLSAYIVSRLEAVQEKYVQTEAGLLASEKSCQNCQVLRWKNEELYSRLLVMENQGPEDHNHDKEFPMDSSCSDGTQIKAVGQEVMVNPLHDNSDQIKTSMPTDLIADAVSNNSGVKKVSTTEVPGFESQTENKAVDPMAPVNGTPEPESVWPSSRDLTEPSKCECNENISALQEQHRSDLESLQAVCEQGFEAMEEAHQRALSDLQLQHQRELDKCLQDKEQLLAEETAATVAAIEAMKKAYQEELEKALQGRHLDNSTPGKDVEEILKRHSEELCSSQRELDVLSQQYSLKCLECAHLAQALEAERHALQQCQRQYQEISVRHQELCGGLARENISPSPLSKEAPIQEKIMYELQIGLRVKRAEVDCLKLEICSLREELQTAQRDKRYAAEKCTDMHKELSTTKARAQRDIEELREHLRLVYKALETSSVDEHLDAGDNN